jgi:hypothetical protein
LFSQRVHASSLLPGLSQKYPKNTGIDNDRRQATSDQYIKVRVARGKRQPQLQSNESSDE